MNDFKLPPGYRAWCHQCGEPPFNKTTEIMISTNPQAMDESQLPAERIMVSIPGVGFKTMDELTDHVRQLHKVWKG